MNRPSVKRILYRRPVAGILAGLMALLVVAVEAAPADGMIFRIARDGHPDSFLVGTMHSEDPRVIGLLPQFEPLIERVDRVALELVPDGVTTLAIGAASMLPAGRRLSVIIGEDRFDELVVAAERLGLPAAVLDRLQPWAAAITLGMPATDTGRFLDMEIYLRALAHGRAALGLESAAEQLAVFQQMPERMQIALLDEMIKNTDAMPTQLELLTTTYLSGDLAMLDRVARDQYGNMPADVVDWFNKTLLDERNARMLERLVPLLDGSSVLVAVGALHLGGPTGLVAGLRLRGYEVRRWSE